MCDCRECNETQKESARGMDLVTEMEGLALDLATCPHLSQGDCKQAAKWLIRVGGWQRVVTVVDVRCTERRSLGSRMLDLIAGAPTTEHLGD